MASGASAQNLQIEFYTKLNKKYCNLYEICLTCGFVATKISQPIKLKP